MRFVKSCQPLSEILHLSLNKRYIESGTHMHFTLSFHKSSDASFSNSFCAPFFATIVSTFDFTVSQTLKRSFPIMSEHSASMVPSVSPLLPQTSLMSFRICVATSWTFHLLERDVRSWSVFSSTIDQFFPFLWTSLGLWFGGVLQMGRLSCCGAIWISVLGGVGRSMPVSNPLLFSRWERCMASTSPAWDCRETIFLLVSPSLDSKPLVFRLDIRQWI